MYHDTIKINFKSNSSSYGISFDYNFLISKIPQNKFSSINYGELLYKFNEIGFNLKYLKFNDLDESDTVYCTYNYQPNFNIFFVAYKKVIENTKFSITFEYGVIINDKFYNNNMNFFSGVWFTDNNIRLGDFNETIINGKTHTRTMEIYQIVDKDGNPIATETTDLNKNFEQHFFERYDVKVALRKYKLGRLNLFQSD